MADGQTYPKLEYLSLTNSGGVAPITWAILSTDFGAAFASGYSNVAQISIPSAPGVSPGTTYPITIRATDALAATTTKVINITAIDYITVTLVITNTDQSRLADAYPILFSWQQDRDLAPGYHARFLLSSQQVRNNLCEAMDHTYVHGNEHNLV